MVSCLLPQVKTKYCRNSLGKPASVKRNGQTMIWADFKLHLVWLATPALISQHLRQKLLITNQSVANNSQLWIKTVDFPLPLIKIHPILNWTVMSAKLSMLWKIYHKQLEFVILSEKKVLQKPDSNSFSMVQFFCRSYSSSFKLLLGWWFPR